MERLGAVPIQDWRYEMRRRAQEIVPGLFVGPYQSSRNREELRELGITDILCITDAREAHLLKPRFPQDFNYMVLEIRDAMDQNLIRIFPQAKAFIDEGLQHGGKVLVHCGDGISRSPAIVTAYLMQTFSITQEKAFDHVQARRFCISPNQNFQHQLEAFQHIHEAALAMAQDKNAGLRPELRRKRSDDSEDDAEVERSFEASRRYGNHNDAYTPSPITADVMDMN